MDACFVFVDSIKCIEGIEIVDMVQRYTESMR